MPASTRTDASGRLLRKKPIPGSRINRSRAIPARSSRGTRSAEEAEYAPPSLVGAESRPERARPPPCTAVHHHEAARRGREIRHRSPGRETLDIIKIRDAAGERETLCFD